jgi:hypothetical protein
VRPRILAVGADCCPDATGLPLLFGVQISPTKRKHKFEELYPSMQVKVDASPFIAQLPSHEVDVEIRNSRDAIPKMSCI